MLDFGSLNYIFAEDQKTENTSSEDQNTYSFVGIENKNGLKKLFLPLGFKSESLESDESYSTKKDLFFLLYRALRKYTGRLKQYQKNRQSKDDRDGAGEGAAANTFSIETDEGTKEVVYTRFSGLDDVLDGFDELRLFALRERMLSSDEIDYSNIHRYLDKATYLPDDTIFIDEVETQKPSLAYHTTDLVRMYCYIYSEIKRELDEGDDISAEVVAEAENFHEHHLSPSDSLFDENNSTCDKLCEQLERIDEQTVLKDDAYLHFYEAIEAVLYPQKRLNKNGIHWGINNFCFVWEDMCQDILYATDPNGILYADTDWHPKGTLSNLITQENCLTFRLNGDKPKTSIKPDAVILNRTWFLLRRGRMFTMDIQIEEIFNPDDNQLCQLRFKITKKIGEQEESKFITMELDAGGPRMKILHSNYTRTGISFVDCYFEFWGPTQTLELGKNDPSNGKIGFYDLNFLEFKKSMLLRHVQKAVNQQDHVVSWYYNALEVPTQCDFLMEWLHSLNYINLFMDYFKNKETLIKEIEQHDNGKFFSEFLAELKGCWGKNGIITNSGIAIVDFKYKQLQDFKLGCEESEQQDIRKQHVYELAIKQNINPPAIKNALIMPGENNHEELLENNGIWLVTWNTRETIESYIGRHQA